MSSIIQRSMTGGELAPSLYARVDTAKYQSGLRTCRNFEVMRHGGVQNRPGSKYVASTKASTATRLIPFIFNASQTYVLEFGNLYMRVIKNGAQLTVTPSAWSGATAYVVGNVVASGGVNYYCILGHTNQIPPNATYWYAMTGSVYEIPTPYATADLFALNYAQSADVVSIAHASYAPRELRRTGDTSWVLATIAFVPVMGTPAGASVYSPAGGTGATYYYKVSAVSSATGEESLPTASFGTVNTGTVSASSGNGLSWTAVSGAAIYNIYKLTPNTVGGVYAYQGSSDTAFFNDVAQSVDFTRTPPVDTTVFASTDNYPATVGYYQQRRIWGATNNYPEKVWASRTGLHYNYTTSFPIQDDNAVSFSLAGRQVNQVKSVLDLGKLLVMTSGAEWAVNGDSAGGLTPFDINAKAYSYNGSATLAPLIIGSNAIYNQARGTIVRELVASDSGADRYNGNDLTIFAAHLFDKYTLADWAFAQIPHSIVWAVRSDGTLLGLTYLPEQQIVGWHRHDTDGTYESVCVVPEDNEDVLYAVVERDGGKYIERFHTRLIDDVQDSVFLDSSVTIDGRNTGATTMTLSGSGWTYTDSLTLTASAATFAAGDVNTNQYWLTGSDGTVIRCTVTGYTGTTVVTVTPHKTVPVSMQGVATLVWTKAIKTITGLSHLEGKNIGVFADGFVVASPNNEAYTVVTVASGQAVLERAYGVIHAGLPYICDIETLDIDTVQGETISDKMKSVNKVTAYTEGSRGIWAGSSDPGEDDPLDGLTELKIREDESYDDPVSLSTGTVDIIIQGEWNSNGRVFLRQVDPIPLSILAVAPAGYFPVGR